MLAITVKINMAKLEDLIKQIPDARLREEVAREVAALKSTKKFGLVFEEHIPEQVQLPGLPVRTGSRVLKRGGKVNQVFQVVDIKGNTAHLAPEPEGQEETAKLDELVIVKRFGEPIYPTLTPRDRVERSPDKPWHTIINADNFHALQLLLYCYEGMLDLIYIDPPYNTGARDWKYNNDYVDVVDEYHHSKWLAMMQKRLALARRLLNPETGVLIVTIDEHEVHHLGVLLETIFPESTRQLVTIVINQKGVSQGRLARVEEYAVYVFMPKAFLKKHHDDLLSFEKPDGGETITPRWERLLRGGNNSRREDRIEFWKSKKDKLNPYRRKLELYGVLQEQETLTTLERVCKNTLDELYERKRVSIEKLPSSRQEEYRRIYYRMQKEPTAEPLVPSIDYPAKKTGTRLEKHLYADETGTFFENFERTSWEPDVLAEELPKPEVVGWLRNLPRKDWSLCVPYTEGETVKPLYPDFIVLRKVKSKVVVDILDPHSSSYSDAIPKAKGLAKYAEKHGGQFGRIELIHKVNSRLKRLELKDEATRSKVLKATERPHLDRLFEELGE